MAVFNDPFDALTNFQQALDTYRASSWLDAGLSGGGAFPPLNVFRKRLHHHRRASGGEEVRPRRAGEGPHRQIGGRRNGGYPEKAALHRRERRAGRFDRAVTMPIEINPDGVKAHIATAS